MQTIAALGGGAFVLASFVTGLRLLFVARRTRRLPEFTLGLGLFLMGGVGYPLTILAQFGSFIPDGGRVALFVGNQLCTLVGLTALAVFTSHVFRPGQGAARAAVFVLASGLLGLVVYRAQIGRARCGIARRGSGWRSPCARTTGRTSPLWHRRGRGPL